MSSTQKNTVEVDFGNGLSYEGKERKKKDFNAFVELCCVVHIGRGREGLLSIHKKYKFIYHWLIL